LSIIFWHSNFVDTFSLEKSKLIKIFTKTKANEQHQVSFLEELYYALEMVIFVVAVVDVVVHGQEK